MLINLDLLLVLSDITRSVPLNTPDRLSIIYELFSYIKEDFKDNPSSYTKESIILNLGFEEQTYCTHEFDFEKLTLTKLIEYLPKVSKTLSNKHEMVDIILLPNVLFCCDKPVKLVSRSYAKVLIYTTDGLRSGRSYQGKCKCGFNYYYGFKENTSKTRTFTDVELPFMLFRNGIVISRDLLKSIDLQISIGNVSFEAAAEVYNNLHNPFTKLNPNRLEDSWFIYKILFFQTSFSEWPRNIKGELDVEKLASNVYPFIRSKIDKIWLKHSCSAVGCHERFVVIDGNEKLYRAICNADKEKLKGIEGEVNTYNLCIRNPIRGNQYRKASKFCECHVNEKYEKSLEPLDIRPVTRSFKKYIPETITSAHGCKEERNVDKFYERTAGMCYIFRPCGIRLSHWEMYTAESLSNIFLYLLDLSSSFTG